MGLLMTQLRQILRMRQISMAVLVSLVAVAAFTSFTSGTSGRSIASGPKKMEAKKENKLVGTWKMVKAKYGGKEYDIPEGTTEFKHITPAHFMLAAIDKDGNVRAAIGGPYTLKGEKYEETPEYGLSEVFTNIKGKPQSFECKVEGAKWYHNGTISNGLTIEEVWERVEPK
jgi:hypothetical protein